MRVWLLKTGEPLPIDSDHVRLLRTGMLAHALSERGHDVTWWSSTFNHQQKRQRPNSLQRVQVNERYSLRLIKSPGYRKNISLARLWDHQVTAKRFINEARKAPRPDLIVSALPTLELCNAARKLSLDFGSKLVIDVRDMWPDIFLRAAPERLHKIAKGVMSPYASMARSSCRAATAITGHAPAFTQWGLDMAGRDATELDAYFPFSSPKKVLTREEEHRANAFWRDLGVDTGSHARIVAFVGAIGHQFDFAPVIDAARELCSSSDIRFVLCGDGEGLPQLRKAASQIRGLVLPGWIDAAQIQTLLNASHVALAPYIQSDDFAASIPNKFVEYLSYGLPILTSLRHGATTDLLAEFRCGASYDRNPHLLAKLIQQYASNEHLRRSHAENAISLYCERFSDTDGVEAMSTHLEHIVDEPRRQLPFAA